MKNILNNSIKLLLAIFGFAFSVISCDYQEVADADYPDQKLYMPTAVGGNYVIDNIPQRIDFLPTPGQEYRFTVDGSKFIVPLGVYRSGIARSGKISVSIAVKNDTIVTLLAASKLPATSVVLPSDKYILPASCEVVAGSEIGTFNLEIDLNYLRSFPDAIFTLGITIASADAAVNPLLKTTVLVIYTKILKPAAKFTSKADAANARKIVFTNSSTYGMAYSWNFGDGTVVATEKAPIHEYAAAGTYTVTLTAVGISGDADKSMLSAVITVL